MTLAAGDPRHGTTSGYRWHKCRCQDCRGHHAAQERKRASLKRSLGLSTKNPMPERLKKDPKPPWNSVPTARIWPLIQEWMKLHDGHSRFSRQGEGGLAELARRLRIDPRAIAMIPHQEWITFRKADRILVAMDRVDLWHTELADIYSLEREQAA